MKIIKSLLVIASFAFLVSCGSKTEVTEATSPDGLIGKHFRKFDRSPGIGFYFLNNKDCISSYVASTGAAYAQIKTYSLNGNKVTIKSNDGGAIQEYILYNNEVLWGSDGVDANGVKSDYGTPYVLEK
jgi:hypothetical protein